jgi:hypothetical protein
MPQGDQKRFIVSVKVLLLHAQEEREHALLLFEYQGGEPPDRGRKLSLLSCFAGEGIEPEQDALPLLVRFVQVGNRSLDALDVCERGSVLFPIAVNG